MCSKLCWNIQFYFYFIKLSTELWHSETNYYFFTNLRARISSTADGMLAYQYRLLHYHNEVQNISTGRR